MPTIELDFNEFKSLLGTSLEADVEKIDEILVLAKAEVKLFDKKEALLSVELKDTNRPDLWSVEGLARALNYYLGNETGVKQYYVEKPIVDVSVDSHLSSIRPFIGCSIIRDVKLTDALIRGLMNLQTKLDMTYGRNRKKTSIGIYDFSLITPPLKYTVTTPDGIAFAPLGFEEPMTLAEILTNHPKGIEYGHIVNKHPVFPILLDSNKKVLSFPPIINSNDLGCVTEETEQLLVEVTGTNHETVLNTLKLVTLALIDRGGKAYSTTVHYPHNKTTVVTPDFSNKQMKLSVSYVHRVLGLNFSGKLIRKLLEKAGFGIQDFDSENITVTIPCYRIDVMHPVDLVEDIGISYGYNNIEPLWRELPTTGRKRKEQSFLDIVSDLMIGLGFQEILSYTLTNPETLFVRMKCKKTPTMEIANPKVQTMTCLRNWLVPSLMEFLGNNQSIEFPQKVFELGKITVPDETKETKSRDEYRLAAAISHSSASFTEIKSVTDVFFLNIGLDWKIRKTKHSSFIEGRVGTAVVDRNEVGTLGEISPEVLEAWNLETPTVAFEINIEKVLKTKYP
ncbi:phenylalanine--tRNA ligase subunit beta [Candidatus Bathyarchaeota archaeon]|nr:phenylalanine--tRNA ligase subunit beta [Candidatus Bathyarchaeota archaeon]